MIKKNYIKVIEPLIYEFKICNRYNKKSNKIACIDFESEEELLGGFCKAETLRFSRVSSF